MASHTLIDFFILGAQKAATTTLASYFQSHPKVNFSEIKEPNYFNWKTTQDEDWYKSLFNNNNYIKGEGSVDYSYRAEFLETHKRIYQHNPRAKFIFILRHPIERLISHYTYNQKRGLTKNQFILWELESKWEYLQRSRYFTEIKPFLRTFPRKQFLFIHFEDFIKQPQNCFDACCDFLDIPYYQISRAAIHNRSAGELTYRSEKQKKLLTSYIMKGIKKYTPERLKQWIKKRTYQEVTRPTLSNNIVRYIYSLIENDIYNLERELKIDVSHWKNYNNVQYL